MAIQRQKFASQADPDLLAQVKEIARREGRQFQAVIEDAMRDYIEKKNTDQPRKQVLSYFEESLAKYDQLYKRLAQ